MAQYAVPDSDTARGAFTTLVGGTTNLWAGVDGGATQDDGDGIKELGSNFSTYIATLTDISTPGDDDSHVLGVRGKVTIAGFTPNVTVLLKQGATTIKSFTTSSFGTGEADRTVALSNAEAAAITDYTDLTITISDNYTKTTGTMTVTESWLQTADEGTAASSADQSMTMGVS